LHPKLPKSTFGDHRPTGHQHQLEYRRLDITSSLTATDQPATNTNWNIVD